MNDQEFEDWRNRQLSGMLNQIETNARWEGAWNIGTGFLTNAQTAKSRLRHVVTQDRKACGDGKWVEQAIYIIDLHPFSMTTYNEDTHGPLNRKRVYRWQWRH